MIWLHFLKEMEPYTATPGKKHLFNWMNGVKHYDVAFENDDLPAAINLFRNAVPELRALAPYLEGGYLESAIYKIANDCQRMVENLTSKGYGFDHIDKFLIGASFDVIRALNCTKNAC